ADEKDEREFYVRMRDSWITVANRYEFLDGIDEPNAPMKRPRSPAGQYIPYPVSRSLERRRGPVARRCWQPLTRRDVRCSPPKISLARVTRIFQKSVFTKIALGCRFPPLPERTQRY